MCSLNVNIYILHWIQSILKSTVLTILSETEAQTQTEPEAIFLSQVLLVTRRNIMSDIYLSVWFSSYRINFYQDSWVRLTRFPDLSNPSN